MRNARSLNPSTLSSSGNVSVRRIQLIAFSLRGDPERHEF
jgi:hypothetical protein